MTNHDLIIQLKDKFKFVVNAFKLNNKSPSILPYKKKSHRLHSIYILVSERIDKRCRCANDPNIVSKINLKKIGFF